MLLRHSLGLTEEAAVVETAVDRAITDGARTSDVAAPGEERLSTREMGEAIRAKLG
jgi:3-isopropylmalate dehydrogenase